MNDAKPLIVWEKWVDPFGQDMDEAKWTDYDNNIKDPNDIMDISPDDEETDIEQEENMLPQKFFSKGNPIKVIASPMGLIPYNEHTASSKIFNFWLGHTNFNITTKIKDIIEECAGVEILDIFTRYRFRVAIGKCFNDSDTMKTINENIHNFLGS
jgi:hypothetical protein